MIVVKILDFQHMKRTLPFLTALIFILSCQPQNQLPESINPTFTEWKMNCSIRALEVIDDNTVWFAGSKGTFGSTNDGGVTWKIDSLKQGEKSLEFRAIATTSKDWFILSVASPAYLFKSTDQGKSWRLVYQEDHPDAFYDCMKFWDDQNGIAMGDPTDGCLSIIKTNDGGESWTKTDCKNLLPAEKGEAAFAASNTNLVVKNPNIWIATGGKKARIFHSHDLGNSWKFIETPCNKAAP